MDSPVTALTRLDLRFEQAVWPFAQERRADIDAHFARLCAEKPQLWNGRVLLLRRWAIEGHVLRGAYMETDFASFIAWRDFGFPDISVFNCFGMAALQSADGAYLLGEMAASTANAGKIYFPSGTPEPADIVDGAVELAASVVRELAEETGLGPDDVTIDDGWVLVQAGTRIALMKPMRARENADVLRRRILAHLAKEEHPELSDIHLVRGRRDVDPQRMPPWMTAFFQSIWG